MKMPSVEIGYSLMQRFGITRELFETNPDEYDTLFEENWWQIFTLGYVFKKALSRDLTNNEMLRLFLDARIQMECQQKGINWQTFKE